jgi:hypothetical protein
MTSFGSARLFLLLSACARSPVPAQVGKATRYPTPRRRERLRIVDWQSKDYDNSDN